MLDFTALLFGQTKRNCELYTMRNNELAIVLKSQLREANLVIASLNERVGQLGSTVSGLQETIRIKDAQIDELVARLSSLEKALGEKDSEIAKQKRIVKGLKGLIGNESEKAPRGTAAPAGEPKMATKPQSAYIPKERGNNGARRKQHFECEKEVIDIQPQDVTTEELEHARKIGVREVVRYVMVPMKFKKLIYRIHKYSLDGTVLQGNVPQAPIYKSNYDGSFIAGLAQLRYMYSLPIERIVRLFNENGFDISAATANGLLRKSAFVFDNLYKALKVAVKSDPYLGCDETYAKVRVDEMNEKGKKIKKGYIWNAVAHNLKLVCFFYDEGSRGSKVFTDFIKGYQGVIQSDGLKIYRKVGDEGGIFEGVMRIACLQHIKRRFIDLEGIREAKLILSLMRKLYHYEHMHKVGQNGWTVEDNQKWRQEYAPPLLDKIEAKLLQIKGRKDLLPDSDLAKAVTYALNEWKYVRPIFTRGDYKLDNNTVEFYNRFISLSRKNSMFFGSHKGAERGAVFYSLACSCHMHGINFFEYISDVLNRAAGLPPTAPIDRFRELLPDKWIKSQSSDNQ